jgi:hypothetical protein
MNLATHLMLGLTAAVGKPWWDITTDSGYTLFDFNTQLCPWQFTAGLRAIFKGSGLTSTPWAACATPPPSIAPAPLRSFPPVGASGLQANLQVAEAWAGLGHALPGVAVYMLDPWDTSAAAVTAMVGAGLLPLCYIRCGEGSTVGIGGRVVHTLQQCRRL